MRPTLGHHVKSAGESAGQPVNRVFERYTLPRRNNHRGTQTITEGTDAIVHLATLPPDGPTGTFQDRYGPVPW
jgi:hypothetical protein